MRYEAQVVGRIKIDKTQFVALDHIKLRSENYSDRKLKKFSAHGCQFDGCYFNNVWIEDASFGSGREMSEYVECVFDGAKFNRMGGGYARFVRCSFRGVEINNWKCFEVELIDCVFSGKLNVGIFNGTPRSEQQEFLKREHNEFHGNDFSGMELNDVAFRTGIDLTKQRLPSGTEYLYLPDASTALRKARVELENWQTTDELRKTALSMLKTSENEVARGQKQLLLRAKNYYGISGLPQKAVDKFFAALRSC
jgi:hypothetical protein